MLKLIIIFGNRVRGEYYISNIYNLIIMEFYNKIETEYTICGDSYKLFITEEKLSEEDLREIQYESFALLKFESNSFDYQILADKENIIKHITERIEKTKNIHLLAKYHHFLSYITKNRESVNKSITYYQKVLAYYLSNYNDNYNILHFADILEEIMALTLKYKINASEIKSQIDKYLFDKELSPKIKTFILERIFPSKLFKSIDTIKYPQLCIDLSNMEIDHNIKERLLTLAVNFSRKTTNIKLFRVANELLGDLEYLNIQPHDDKNMAISHINENSYKKIIKYYKLAGKKEKQVQAIKDLEINKKNHRYIKYQSSVPLENEEQIRNMMNEHIEKLLNNPPSLFVYSLCFSDTVLLLPSYCRIQSTVKEQMNKTTYHQFFESKLVDLNENVITVPHEVVIEHKFFNDWWKNNTLPFVINLFDRAIREHKVNYTEVKNALLKTAFGMKLEIPRGGPIFIYNWFSLIDIGIREFFKQLIKHINNKETDWRFSIDFLAPKFEAILREIIHNNGGDVTKVEDNDDTKLKSLEELLASPVTKKIFSEDNIFLFKHTFTRVGLNIRNDVAHGLYKPCDYTLSKAMLVLLCILKLNKVYIFNRNESFNEEDNNAK